jgi:hypothetical protein
MPFQCREQNHALKTRIRAVGSQHPARDRSEQAFVVVAFHARLRFSQPVLRFAVLNLVVECRRVESLLGRKVPEDNRLRHTGRGR